MTMVSEAGGDGELTDRESELIRNAIEFDDQRKWRRSSPRVDVIAVEDDLPLDEVAQTFAESGYSRLPVYHGTMITSSVSCTKGLYLARLKKATLKNWSSPRSTPPVPPRSLGCCAPCGSSTPHGGGGGEMRRHRGHHHTGRHSGGACGRRDLG